MSQSNLPKIRQRLLVRIARRYHTLTENVEIGGLRFSFTRIANPDRVLDEVAAEADLRDRLKGTPAPGDELHLPYWAELWESGRGMGEYLVKNWVTPGRGDGEMRGHGDVETRGRGDGETRGRGDGETRGHGDGETQGREDAGMGRRGDSDRSGNSLEMAGISTFSPSPRLPVPASLPHTASLPHRVLDLGCGMGMAGTVAAAMGAKVVFADLEAPALLFAQLNSLPWRRRIQTRRLNWQRDRLDRQFDLILGADILYERAQWPFLEAFWNAHLRPGGKVLLGEPGRQTGDLFIEWIAARGWNLVRTDIEVASRPKPIRILAIHRR